MLSLSMIVKNEEKYLKDCLESVKDVADEIIIVDTGSTDGTLGIAETFGAKIYKYDWENDFSAARNFSLSKCTGKLILYLDADERLHPDSKKIITKIKKTDKPNGYNCKIINLDEVNNRPSVMTYIRLFPNNKNVSFSGKVHEQIETSLLKNNYKIEESDISILHIGYSIGREGLKIKAKRNLIILLNEYEKNKSSYYAFHLGQTYNILEHKEEAMRFFKIAVKDKNIKKEYLSTSLRVLAVYESEMGNLEQAVTFIEKAIYYDKDQPLNYMVASNFYKKSGDIKRSILFIEKALGINRESSKNNYKSSQNILLDDYLIICTGLLLSIEGSDNTSKKYFSNELINLSNQKPGLKAEINFLLILLEGKAALTNIRDIKEYTNDSNLELVIKLLTLSSDIQTVGSLFESLAEKHYDSAYVLKEYAMYSLKMGDTKKAEKLFDKAIELNTNDPSVYFYLVSLYIQSNRIDKLRGVLNKAQELFANNPAVISQLNKLRQKLSQII
jgi:glycosyltransferase involved in cell wall biosynthesis